MSRPPSPPLDTDHLLANLGDRALKGGVATISAQAIRLVFRLGSTMILARILTPEDFGLIAMVTAVLSFVAVFKDLGLIQATVQRASVSDEQVTALFWTNAGFGILLTGVGALFAPLIAEFYGSPELLEITLALATSFLLGGLGAQHEALLQRQMRFRYLAVLDVVAFGVAVVAAVSSAAYGAGYWALVILNLVSPLVTTVGHWLGARWIPGRPRWTRGIRSLLRFGGNITAYNFVNYFARHLDDVLIGRVWGASALGLYTKAYELLRLPAQQINRPLTGVGVSALSRLYTEDRERYRLGFIAILEKLAAMTVPMMAMMIASADWIVDIVLGPGWEGVVPIFVWLGVAGLLQPVGGVVAWLFVSQDRTDDQLKWGLIATPITLTAILCGLPWGPVGVAVAYGIAGPFVRSPLHYWYVGRRGPVGVRDIVQAIWPAGVAAFAAWGAITLARTMMERVNPVLGLAAVGLIGVFASAATLFTFPSGRRILRDSWTLVRRIVDRSSADQSG